MITQEDSIAVRKLCRLEVARVVLGVAVIVAVFAVVLCGIDAFTKERDSWLAMRLPLAISILLIAAFARSAKAIVALAAKSSPMKKEQNQFPQPPLRAAD